jgi:hypothetical protein
MSALHAELVSMNVLLTQSQKAISIQLMLIFVLIVAHVPRFARLTQFRLPNNTDSIKLLARHFRMAGLFYGSPQDSGG